MIIEELESQLNEINSGNNKNKNENNKNNDNIFNCNNNDKENRYKNLFCRPNNSGLINHLKKENERLRKLVISYEFKNKNNNIYKLKNNNDNIFEINFILKY